MAFINGFHTYVFKSFDCGGTTKMDEVYLNVLKINFCLFVRKENWHAHLVLHYFSTQIILLVHVDMGKNKLA